MNYNELTDEDKKQYKKYLRTWLGRQLTDTDLHFIKTFKKGQGFGQIPLKLNVIDSLAEYLEQEGIVEGIFRISAEGHAVRALWSTFNKGEFTAFQKVSNVHVVACSLKLYLREQDPPFFPYELYDSLINSQKLEESQSLDELEKIINSLPAERKEILQRLILMLKQILEGTSITKMDVKNFGIVFGPTLLRPKVSTMDSIYNSTYENQVIVKCIEHYDDLFPPDFKRKYTLSLISEGYGVPYLTERDWRLLLSNANVHTFNKGEIVLKAGTPNTTLYRVKEGTFSVQISGKKVATLIALDIFGDMSILGNYPTSADIISEEDSATLWALEASFINDTLFKVEKELVFKFYSNLAIEMANRVREWTYRSEDIEEPKKEKRDQFRQVKPAQISYKIGGTEEPLKQIPSQFKQQSGTLYIGSKAIEHYSHILGFDSKIKLPLIFIKGFSVNISEKENKYEIILLFRPNSMKTFSFFNKEDCDSAVATLNIVCKHLSGSGDSFDPSSSDMEGLEISNPTQDDWKEIYGVNNGIKFSKGDIIIKENSTTKESVLYILQSGTCVEEKDVGEGQKVSVLKYNPGETLGELAFLFGGKAISSIIADSDQVELIPIKGNHLKSVFEKNQSAGARFFKSMADTLARRLRVLQS